MALSRQQLNELKSIVESRCLALDAEIRADTSRARDAAAGTAAAGGMDKADVAIADQAADLGNAELMRDLHELRELQDAQTRLATGSYGRCIDCGTDIAYSRLRAQPAASRCLACQQIYDSTHAHAATPKL